MSIPVYKFDSEKSIKERLACALNCLPDQLIGFSVDNIQNSTYKITAETTTYPRLLRDMDGDVLLLRLQSCIDNYKEYKTAKDRVFEHIYYKQLFKIDPKSQANNVILLLSNNGGMADDIEELILEPLFRGLGYEGNSNILFRQITEDFYKYISELKSTIETFNDKMYKLNTYIKELDSLGGGEVALPKCLVTELYSYMTFKVDYTINELFDRFIVSDRYPIIKLNGVHKVNKNFDYTEKLKNIKYKKRIRPIVSEEFDDSNIIYIWDVQRITEKGKLYKYKVIKISQMEPFRYKIATITELENYEYTSEDKAVDAKVMKEINMVINQIDITPQSYQKFYKQGIYSLVEKEQVSISYKMNFKLVDTFFINDVLKHVITTTPALRYFVNVNDNFAEQKKEEPSRFPIVLEHDNYIERIMLTKYKVNFSHQIPYYMNSRGKNLKMDGYTINTNYVKLSMNMKRENIIQIPFIQWIFSKLMIKHREMEKKILENFSIIDGVRYRELMDYSEKMLLIKQITIKDIEEIFPPKYSVACVKGRKPIIIDDIEKRREHIITNLNLRLKKKIVDPSKIDFTPFEMKFPKETIIKDNKEIVPHWYVARLTQSNYIYPGLVSLSKTPLGLEYAPCTFQTRKVGVPGSKYDLYINNKKESIIPYKIDVISKTTNVIKNPFNRAKFGVVPPIIEKLSLHTPDNFLKTGVPFSPNSVIWCLEYAFGRIPKDEEAVLGIRRKIMESYTPTKVKQQTSMVKWRDESFFDPKILIRVLEDVYSVNIHIVSDYQNELGMLELPYNRSIYYKNFKYNKHVFLFRHESTQNIHKTIKPNRTIFLEYEHYELIGKLDKDRKYGISAIVSTDPQDDGSPGIVFDKIFIQNIMDVYRYFYRDRMIIYDRIILGGGSKVTGQYLDSYGNVRGIFVKLSSNIECFFYFLHPSEPFSEVEERNKGVGIDGKKIYIDTAFQLLACFPEYKLKSIVKESADNNIGIIAQIKDRTIYIPQVIVKKEDDLNNLFKGVQRKIHIQENDFFIEINQLSSLDIYNTRQNAVMQFINNVYRIFSYHIKDYNVEELKNMNTLKQILKTFFQTYMTIGNMKYQYKSDINEFDGMLNDNNKLVVTQDLSRVMFKNIVMRLKSDPSYFNFPYIPKLFYRNVKKLYRENDDAILMVGNQVFNYWLSKIDVSDKQNIIYDEIQDEEVQFLYLKDTQGVDKKYIARKFIYGEKRGSNFIGIQREGKIETREDADKRILNIIVNYLSTYDNIIKVQNITVKRYVLNVDNKLNLYNTQPSQGQQKAEVNMLYTKNPQNGFINAYWITEI